MLFMYLYHRYLRAKCLYQFIYFLDSEDKGKKYLYFYNSMGALDSVMKYDLKKLHRMKKEHFKKGVSKQYRPDSRRYIYIATLATTA